MLPVHMLGWFADAHSIAELLKGFRVAWVCAVQVLSFGNEAELIVPRKELDFWTGPRA